MADQIIPIDEITRRAQHAVEIGLSITACPYPHDSDAAIRWQKAYHAKEMELIGEAA